MIRRNGFETMTCSYCGRVNYSVIVQHISDVTDIDIIINQLGKNIKICTYCNNSLQNNISKIENGLIRKFNLEYEDWIPIELVLKPEPYCVKSENREETTYKKTMRQNGYHPRLPFASKQHMEEMQKISQEFNDKIEKRQNEDFRDRGGLIDFPSVAGFYIKDFSYPKFLAAVEQDRVRKNEVRKFSEEEYTRVKNETLDDHSYMFNEAINKFLEGRKAATKRRTKQEEKKRLEEERWKPVPA